MKKLTISWLRAGRASAAVAVAAAAMLSLSCQKEACAPVESAPEEGYMRVNFHAGFVETRTEFAAPEGKKYPTLWNAGDRIAITLASKCSDADSVVVTPKLSADRKTVGFKADIPVSTAAEDAFCAVVPAIAVKSLSAANRTWNLEIPATQTPAAGSPDPQAQILWARTPFSGTPPEADLAFSHFVAYGKLSLKNFNPEGATVKSISLETEVPLTGRYFLFIDDATKDGVSYKAGDVTGNVPAKTLTVNTSSTSDVWFACLPADLSNTTLKITVTTDASTYNKTVTVPANHTFEAGKVTGIHVDMGGIVPTFPTRYFKVTATDQLKDGDELIIAGYGVDKSNADYKGWFALTDSQKGNNRQATLIEVLEGGTMIQDPAANVETVVLEKASTEGGWYLRATKHGGYLYAAATKTSSNNYLRTATADGKDASGNEITSFEERRTWRIAINEDGTANILSNLFWTHTDFATIIRLNVDNLTSNPIISCYTVKSTAPLPSIFRKGDAETPIPDVEKQWVIWMDKNGRVYYDENGDAIQEGFRQIYDIGYTAKGKLLVWNERENSLGFFSGFQTGPYAISLTAEGNIMVRSKDESEGHYCFFIFENVTENRLERKLYYWDYEANYNNHENGYWLDSYGYHHANTAEDRGVAYRAVETPVNLHNIELWIVMTVEGRKYSLNSADDSAWNEATEEYDYFYRSALHFRDDIMNGTTRTIPILRMNNAGTKEDFAKVDVKGKIAVVDRGSINFHDKWVNAIEAGAIALICVNNQPGILNASIGHLEDASKGIPFFTITQEEGRLLDGKTSIEFSLTDIPLFAGGE